MNGSKEEECASILNPWFACVGPSHDVVIGTNLVQMVVPVVVKMSQHYRMR